MLKGSTRKSGPARRRNSSPRARRNEGPVERIHRVRREMAAEKKRLGLSEAEYLKYMREELRKKGHAV